MDMLATLVNFSGLFIAALFALLFVAYVNRSALVDMLDATISWPDDSEPAAIARVMADVEALDALNDSALALLDAVRISSTPPAPPKAIPSLDCYLDWGVTPPLGLSPARLLSSADPAPPVYIIARPDPLLFELYRDPAA